MKMETILFNMIEQAEREENYNLIKYAKEIVDKFATTINAPSNWRYFYMELLRKYDSSSWVYEEMELWNYED